MRTEMLDTYGWLVTHDGMYLADESDILLSLASHWDSAKTYRYKAEAERAAKEAKEKHGKEFDLTYYERIAVYYTGESMPVESERDRS